MYLIFKKQIKYVKLKLFFLYINYIYKYNILTILIDLLMIFISTYNYTFMQAIKNSQHKTISYVPVCPNAHSASANRFSSSFPV